MSLFSSRHRVRSLVGLAAAGLVVSLATAIPGTAAEPDPVDTSTEVAEPTDSDDDGVLDAPDTQAAVAGAVTADEPVEDLSQKTETVSVVANPDSTFTATEYGTPVRIQRDGDWVPVDYDLERQDDGSWAPKAAPVDVTIDGGGAKEAARVTFDDGQSLAVTWPSNLPEPTVDGGVATYQLSEATDLLVAVTSGGVNTHIRLNKKPADDDPVFRLGLRADGVDVDQTPAGGLKITDDNQTVATTSALIAWDATTDAAGDPANIVELDATLDQAGTNGAVTTHTLDLTTPDGFLTNPDTLYPITIDPNISTEKTRDTWVRNGDTAKGTDNKLIVGKINPDTSSNANPARSYLKFYNSVIEKKPNVVVSSATLGLYQYYGYTCNNRPMNVHGVTAAWADTITWANRPDIAGTPATVAANRIGSNATIPACGSGWTNVDVTSIAKRWAAGTLDMQGVRLAANDETAHSYERRFCSMNPTSGTTCGAAAKTPTLTVTYNTYPSTASAPEVEVVGSHATVSTSVDDPDGGQVRAIFEVKRGSTVAYSGTSSFGAAEDEVAVDLPPLADGSYTVQAWANDGSLTSRQGSAITSFTVDTSSIDTFGGYFPVLPHRAVDTTAGVGLQAGAISPGSTTTVDVAGSESIPDEAVAVFASVQVPDPSASGSLRIGPSDAAAALTPTAITFETGTTAQTGRVIELSRDGKFSIISPAGAPAVELAIDVHGYFSGAADGGEFTPLATSEFYDTASEEAGALAPGESRELQVLGAGNIPDDGQVDSIMMTIGVRDWGSSGSVTVSNPDDNAASSIVFSGTYVGNDVTTTAVVPVSEKGTVVVTNSSSGTASIGLVSQGWFSGPYTVGVPVNAEARVLIPKKITDSTSTGTSFTVPMSSTDRLTVEGDRVNVLDGGNETVGYYTFEVRTLENGIVSGVTVAADSETINVRIPSQAASAYPLDVQPTYASLETIEDGQESAGDTCPPGQMCTTSVIVKYQMLSHSKKMNVINRKFKDRLGRCHAASNGLNCSISSGRTTSRSWGLALGASVKWVAGQLNYSSSSSVTVTVGCSTVKLKKGQSLYGRPIGSRHKYKIRKHTIFLGSGTVTETSGWRYSYNPYQRDIACEIVKES